MKLLIPQHYSFSFAGILFIFLGSPIFGQETKEEALPAEVSEAELEEIVELDPFEIKAETFGYAATFSLSGSRVATRLRDLPRQINVITSELAEDTNSTTVSEAVDYASSTNFLVGDNLSSASKAQDPVSSLILRGFEISTLYRNFNPTLYSPWGPFVDRVEVVKGPASTLYGRAAPGGLVNIITKRPQSINSTKFRASVGVTGLESYRGIVDHQETLELMNRPFAYRIVAGVQVKDGPKDFTPDDRHGALVSLDWEFTPRDKIIFDFEAANERGHDVVSLRWKEPEDEFSKRKTTLPSFPQNRKFNPKPSYDYGEVWSNRVIVEYRRQFSPRFNLQLNYEHGYRRYEGQFTTFAGIRMAEEVFTGDSTYNPFTDEVRVGYQRRWQDHVTDGFTGNLFLKFDALFGKHEWLIGGTIYDEDFDVFTETIAKPTVTRSGIKFFPTALNLMTTTELEEFRYPDQGDNPVDLDNNNLNDLEWALGEDTHRNFRNKGFYITNTSVFFNNRLRLLAGTRYDFLEQGQLSLRLVKLRSGDVISLLRNPRASQNRWTYQLAAMVNLSENFGYYISEATSVVQQFIAVRERHVPPSFAVPAVPLDGKGWETGIKFGLFDQKLSGTIAYFHSVEKNRAKDTGTDRFGAFQRIAKGQEAEGVEIDWVFQPFPNWQTVISGAYLSVLINVLSANDPASDRFNRPPSVPQWQGRVFSKYSFTGGPLKNIEVGIGMEGIDDSRTGGEFSVAGDIIDNYHLQQFYVWDLMVAYEGTRGESNWRLQLNIDNMFDRRYFEGGSNFGLPRWGELTFSVGF